MKSSSIISLLSEQPENSQPSYSLVVSALAHGAAIGMLVFGVFSVPEVKVRSASERYAIRQLELHTLEPKMERAAALGAQSLRPHPSPHPLPPGENPITAPSVLQQIAQVPIGPQTLIQPDIAKPIPLTEKIPLPKVVIWNATKTPAKILLAPLPQPPPVADIKPSVLLPNEETKLADLAIPATNKSVRVQPVPPSTTTPVVAAGPKPTPPAPVTTAAGSAQSTSATVISLSYTRMNNGTVALPAVNQKAASSNSSGTLAPGAAKDSAQAGSGNAAGKTNGAAAGKNSDNAANSKESDSSIQKAGGLGLGDSSAVTHIKLAESGQFGAVVVGSSLEEKYPETAEVWSGRLAYTVYLHVGLAKSWILQYSLSRSDDAAASGNIEHIEAPWPYSIVRPNLAPGAIDSDALMVHGFVNQAGRFESLAIAFPPHFELAQFVLSSLAQWQFRPATQNGKNVKVEVLLIIPEVQE